MDSNNNHNHNDGTAPPAPGVVVVVVDDKKSPPITRPAFEFYNNNNNNTNTKILYNRQGDIEKLVTAYRRRMEQPQLVLLVGQPGNGKTTLGHSLRPYVVGGGSGNGSRSDDEVGFYAAGRFDPLDYPEPYGPLVDICEQLMQSLLDGNPNNVVMNDNEVARRRFANALHTNMTPKDIQAIGRVWPNVVPKLLPNMVFDDDYDEPSSSLSESMAATSSKNINKSKIYSKSQKSSSKTSKSDDKTSSASRNSTTTTKANCSLVVAILQIFRAMTRTEKPIAMFVDDLHFAEKASLEVLKLAMADPKISIFCMVAFRPVNVQHPSSVWLQTLEAGGVKFLPLVPSPIDNADEWIINGWMTDIGLVETLGLPTDQLQTIGETIAKETAGNACAIQLCLQIMSLNDEIVRQTGGTPLQAGGDVRSLFQLLFMMLSPMCQKACWTASCMGMVVDVSRLKRIVGEGLEDALEEAERHGVLQYIELNSNAAATTTTTTSSEEEPTATGTTETTTMKKNKTGPGATGYYAFANLTYRDCVYGLISPKDRNMQHTAIGNIYRQDIDTIGVFRVVEHLSLGRELLSPKQIQAFARICLTAGDLAKQWGELQSAARHYDLGVDLLNSTSSSSHHHRDGRDSSNSNSSSNHNNSSSSANKQKWKANYHLCLALYNGSAAVYSSLGEFEEMDARLTEILNHAKDTTDKVQANVVQVKALVSQTRHSDAIALGLKVLPKLEEPVKKYSAESELKATRKLLEGKSEERILCSPTMEDEKKVGAMEIMNSLIASALVEQGDLIIALSCRIVKATLRYGLSGPSAVGLCMLGAILCLEGEVDDGLWCSNAGLELIEMIEDKSCKGRVMAIHWGLMIRFVQPLKSCQEPLKMAYRLCVEGGDNDFALVTPMLSAFNMVVAGGTLSSTTEAMKSLYQLLHKKNQDTLLRIVRPFFQMSLNLLGVSTETDPTILTGSIMVEQDDYAYASQTRNVKIEYCLLLCQSMLAFYLHKFESARLLMEKLTALKDPGVLISALDIHVCFFDAMTAIGMAWVWIRKIKADVDMDKKEKKHLTEQKAKLISSAERCLGKLRIFARYAPANLNQRVQIIQAELNAINGNVDEADKLFQKAMAHAEENGQLSDRALACERAGLAMRSCGKEDNALNYLEDCCAMYRHWGALIKVNHVKGNVIPQAIYEWDT